MIATILRCRVCESVEPASGRDRCARCDGPQDVTYEWDALRGSVTRESLAAGPASMWRYAAMLPVQAQAGAPGWTPLVQADRLSEQLGIDLWVKLENENPSGSFRTGSPPSPGRRPPSSGSRRSAAPRRATSATPSPRRRRCGEWTRSCWRPRASRARWAHTSCP